MNMIKYKTERCIAIMPLSSKVLYKTAEYVGNPFDIAWNNIFIFDLHGNKNDYYVFENAPIFSNKKTGLCIKMNGDKIGLGSFQNERNSINKCDKEKAQLFCDWINKKTNDFSKLFFKIVARRPSRPFLNKLWEIYNAKD